MTKELQKLNLKIINIVPKKRKKHKRKW